MVAETEGDRAVLRKLAEAATPGPWRRVTSDSGDIRSEYRDHPVCNAYDYEDVDYIPSAIIELLDEISYLEKFAPEGW